MNIPDIIATQPATMTSFEIAEVMGKQHKDVLRAIRNMETAWEKVRGRKFALSLKINELPNGGKKETPYYNLNKTECLYIATKFNDEARARLVLRWEQLENERKEPPTADAVMHQAQSALSRRDYLLMLAETDGAFRLLRSRVAELAAEVLRQEETIRMQDKFIMRMAQPSQSCPPPLPPQAPHGRTYTATQLAAEYGMKASSFNNLMQQLGMQYAAAGQWLIVPDYAYRGYTAVKYITVTADDGRKVSKPFTVWTEAGRQFIRATLAMQGIHPEADTTRKGGIHV